MTHRQDSRRQRTDNPFDPGKQSQNGKPQDSKGQESADKQSQKRPTTRGKDQDAGKQSQKGQPQDGKNQNGAGKQSQKGQPQDGDKQNGAGKQSQKGQPQDGDKQNGAGKQSQKGQPQDDDKQNHAGQQSQKGQPKDGDKQKDAGQQGQKSEGKEGDKYSPPEHLTDIRRQARNSPDKSGNSKDDGAAIGWENQGQPQHKNVERKDASLCFGGHGSGVVYADLNDDGLIDVFVFGDDNKYPRPNREPQRAQESKDTTKQGPKSQPHAGAVYKQSGKSGPKGSLPRGSTKNGQWPTIERSLSPPTGLPYPRLIRAPWSRNVKMPLLPACPLSPPSLKRRLMEFRHSPV